MHLHVRRHQSIRKQLLAPKVKRLSFVDVITTKECSLVMPGWCIRVTTTLPDFTLQLVLPESPEFIFQLTLGFEFYLRTLGTPNHMFSSTRYPIFQFTIVSNRTLLSYIEKWSKITPSFLRLGRK